MDQENEVLKTQNVGQSERKTAQRYDEDHGIAFPIFHAAGPTFSSPPAEGSHSATDILPANELATFNISDRCGVEHDTPKFSHPSQDFTYNGPIPHSKLDTFDYQKNMENDTTHIFHPPVGHVQQHSPNTSIESQPTAGTPGNGDFDTNQAIVMENPILIQELDLEKSKSAEHATEDHSSQEPSQQDSVKSTAHIDQEITEGQHHETIQDYGASHNEGEGQPKDTPPTPQLQFDRGYSWVILVAGTLINAFSWGASGAYGVFLANFLDTNKYPDATSIDFAFVGGLQFGIGLMLSPFVTFLNQRFPYKMIIASGAIVIAVAYIAASFATRKWHLYVTQGLLNGIGVCMVFVAAYGTIPQWFLKRRGVANGVFTAGAGIGSIIFSLSVQSLIDSVGLAWTQRYVGILCCGMNMVCVLFIRERRSLFKKRSPIFNGKLLKRFDIWMAIIWGTLAMFCYGIVLYTMAPYAVSKGLTHKQGSVLSSLISAGIIIGRPTLGYLADVIGSINAALISTFLSTLFILAWWIPSHTYGSLIVCSLFLGGVISAFSVGFPPICVSLVDFEDLGAMMSMSWFVVGGLNIFSTPAAIGLSKINGSYLYSQIFTGCLFFLSGCILMGTRTIQLRKAEINRLNLHDEEEGFHEAREKEKHNKGVKTSHSQVDSVATSHTLTPYYKIFFRIAKV